MRGRRITDLPREEPERFQFDEHLTTDLDSTNTRLKELRGRPHDSESNRWQYKAIDDLTLEVKQLRKDLSNLVRALDKKASISSVTKFEDALSDRMDERLDKQRSVAMWAVGLLVGLIGVLRLIH